MLEDIAILTGGKIISEETGMKMENVELDALGHASKIISTKDSTTIVGGKGKKKDIEVRVAQIKNEIEKSSSKYDKEKLQKRLAKLSGGVAVIRVGAATESELAYHRAKMEDALAATRAALEEGVISGGGVALAKAADTLLRKSRKLRNKNDLLIDMMEQEFNSGVMILINACVEPLKQIVRNSGVREEAVVLDKIMKKEDKNYGYDAKEDQFKDDMIKAGIIDPLKVTRTALENAVSVAAILLTTEVAITDQPEEKCKCGSDGGAGMPGGMGGMM
jgi:chaperonin GroEL